MLNTTTHNNVLIKILKDIYADNTLGPLLGFKGGTAAMLFYGLDRHSVDLDFDLLDPEKEEYVVAKIGKILLAYGKIIDQKVKHFTLFFMLSYSDKDRNIKVEINRRKFESQYTVKSYLGISMKVMVREDMFANKMAALYERGERTNRDIFDVWYFLQHDWPINKALLEKRIGLPFAEILTRCIAKLEKIPGTSVLSGMGELLTPTQKAWAKAKLKTEILFLLKLMLENEKRRGEQSEK